MIEDKVQASSSTFLSVDETVPAARWHDKAAHPAEATTTATTAAPGAGSLQSLRRTLSGPTHDLTLSTDTAHESRGADGALVLHMGNTLSASRGVLNAPSARRVSVSSVACISGRRNSWMVAQDVLKAVSFTHSLRTLRDSEALQIDYNRDLAKQSTIGEGAFGVVEKCRYLPHNRLVAVKKLKIGEKMSQQDVLDMMREIALMRKLRSPFIVEFVGSGWFLDRLQNKIHFLVEEFVDGGTLKHMVSMCIRTGRGIYTMQDAVRWLTDVARGLQYLHESIPMVIHRDMKLENILLKGTDPHTSRAKICDLGLSTLIRPAEMDSMEAAAPSGPRQPSASRKSRRTSTVLVQEWSELAKNRTQSKEKKKNALLQVHNAGDRLEGRIGTWLYMAPEVYRQEPYNEKADVFSYAVVMYELLHRYRMSLAVASMDEAQIYARRVATKGYRPPIEPLLPFQMQSLIESCWHADAAQRPSMAEVVKHLQHAEKHANWGPYAEAEQRLEQAQLGCGCVVS